VELLGLKPEHYFYLSDIGKELLNNKHLFLSKKAVFTFGSYASSQLRRLDNKAARTIAQAEKEQHILNSITAASYAWPEKYECFKSGEGINLYLDTSDQEDMDKEIFMDIHLTHYPLRDYKNMWSDMKNVVSDYGKIGHRNQNAIERGKLGKHMMHLLRLYMTGIDILEKKEIITCRENEHDLLMSIRNGDFLDENSQPTEEFNKLVDEYQKRMDAAAKTTTLPDAPDMERIQKMRIVINKDIVTEK
jgi:predicted nucleotidyltransferase